MKQEAGGVIVMFAGVVLLLLAVNGTFKQVWGDLTKGGAQGSTQPRSTTSSSPVTSTQAIDLLSVAANTVG